MPTRIYLKIVLLSLLLIHRWVIGFAQDKQPDKMQFTRLTTANGLSQSTINAIVKDKAGFMWFGTADGLNRFDGYKFKNYRNIPGDLTSLPYNLIKTLFVDKGGTLWVGTLGGGLTSYDEKTDSFSRYDIGLIQNIFEDHTGILWVGTFDGLFIVEKRTRKVKRAERYRKKFKIFNQKIITSILEDRNNNLWVGTRNGLYLFHANSEKITSFFAKEHSERPTNVEITALAQDQKGRFWLGTSKGLHQYDYKTRKFLAAKCTTGQKEKTMQMAVNSLCCDENDVMWIGTDDGLGRYDLEKRAYNTFRTNAYDVQSLSRNSVNALYADNQILWVGTALGGINKYDKQQSFLSHYKISNSNNQQGNTNVVTSFAGSLDGEMWIGTDGGGLFIWKSSDNSFTPFGCDNKGTSIFGKSVLCLLQSRDGQNLWIGTYNKGLFQLNLKTKALTRHNSIENNAVYAVLEDKKSNIWVGTNGGGVHVINTAGHPSLQLTKDIPGTLTNNYIRALMEDEKGKIWIGTYGGLNIFDPETKKFVAPKPSVPKLYRHLICALFKDSSNKVWIGTQGAGVLIYDQLKNNLITLTETQGLSNNNISSITGDKKGFVWISTSRGLNRLAKNNKAFTSFLSEDGVQTDEFIGGANFMSANGEILFGSVDGFHLVKPANYKRNTFVPSVVITDFQVPSNSISRNKALKFNVSNSGIVSLAYNQSAFTIEYSALNYSSTANNKYACKLEGLDNGWQYLGHERKVTYNNLGPGEYLFKVKAANNDGIWNDDGPGLKIIIHPPLWRTNFAYVLYALATVLVLNSVLKGLKTREKLKNELIFQKLTSDKIKEMHQLKINFFTNISHELRTPLSLIVDPIRKISQEDLSINQTKFLSKIAFNNAARLLNLVNQLLDFRKFEGSLKLEPATVNIRNFIYDVAMAFNDRANKRNLNFLTVFNINSPLVTVDPDKFHKVIINLISNAFKFTPDGGRITLTTSIGINERGERQMEISVADTGPGVPVAYKTKIFDMFFQLKNIPRFEIESSGIGLALVKELMHLHDGDIIEHGTEGEGALFTLKLPVGEATTKEINSTPIKDDSNEDQYVFEQSEASYKDIRYNSEITILVVEDNEELRTYIAGFLSTYYDVEVGTNGHEGYQKARALIPNLIVSDVMMKDGDGLELCQRVKSDEKTSHIPVILLTAKLADENRIQGYKSGADAYILKPFNSELLKIRISNLLESRKKLRETYTAISHDCINSKQKLSELDQEFMEKAKQAVLANLLELSFDVEVFASILNMNRRQLARKLKAIIDKTPQEYMIDVRLGTAVQLMLHQDMNISQAAYQVGFSEPANFSRSFSKVYGLSPKKYLKEKYGKTAL